MRLVLKPYQVASVEALLANPYMALFARPGTGKTAVSLALIKILHDRAPGEQTLVLAPLQVCVSTWPAEFAKWSQLIGITHEVATGSKRFERLRASTADVVITNYESLLTVVTDTIQIDEGVKTVKKYKYTDSSIFARYKTLIVDELTAFANWTSLRTKSLRRLLPMFARRHGLTGTPMSNTMEDLFSQIYIIDKGESLGKIKTPFIRRYFHSHPFKSFELILNTGAETEILERIAPSVHTVDDDGLDGLTTTTNDRDIPWPDAKTKKIYFDMQRLLATLVDNREFSAASAGVAYGKCRQILAGAIYDTDKKYTVVHKAKWSDAVRLIRELQGDPLLFVFRYKFEIIELSRLLGYKVPSIDGSTKATTKNEIINSWDRGELPVVGLHPQSGGKGLNMQLGGCNMYFATVPDKLEDYDQTQHRILRQGATRNAIYHRAVIRGTLDELAISRLETRAGLQAALFDFLRSAQRGG